MSHAAYLPDHALAMRAVAGDASAIGELVERFAPALYDLAVCVTKDGTTAAHLTVDALVRLATGEVPAAQPRHALLLAAAVGARSLMSRQWSRHLRRQTSESELAAALAALSIEEALALALTVRHGLADNDVAPVLGLTPSTVAEARERALDRLRATFVTRKSHRRWALVRGATPAEPGRALRHIATCRRCRELSDDLPATAALLTTAGPPLSRELLDDLCFRVIRALPVTDAVEADPLGTGTMGVQAVELTAAPDATPTTREVAEREWRAVHWPSVWRASRDSDGALGRRTPLGLLVTVAIIAVLTAAAAARSIPAEAPSSSDESRMAAWPTLPARAMPTRSSTPLVAIQPPIIEFATATPVAPRPVLTATTVAASRSEPEQSATPVAAVEPTPSPPSFAAARGAPVPVPPAPRTIGPPPGPVTPPATASPTPTARGTLRVLSAELSFGLETGPRLIEFSNVGKGPLTWRATGDSTWLTIVQASGVLLAGQSARIAVTVDRGALPTGSYTGAVELRNASESEIVAIGMLVSPTRAVVTTSDEPAEPINAAGCASPTTRSIAADITADTPPRQVLLYYSLNGGTELSKPLGAVGKRYTVVLGPFNEPGAVTYSMVITEADGTISRTAAHSVVVQDCPSRARAIPVTLPTSRRFAIGDRGHDMYTFTLTEPGNLIAQLSWTGSSPRLSTLLYGPRHADQPYEKRTGTTALTFSFPVTAADVAAGGSWALHVANYDVGDATGTLVLTFEPRGAPVPATAPTPPPSSPTPSPTPTAPRPPSSPTTAPTDTPATTPVQTRTPTAPSPMPPPGATPTSTTPAPTATSRS